MLICICSSTLRLFGVNALLSLQAAALPARLALAQILAGGFRSRRGGCGGCGSGGLGAVLLDCAQAAVVRTEALPGLRDSARDLRRRRALLCGGAVSSRRLDDSTGEFQVVQNVLTLWLERDYKPPPSDWEGSTCSWRFLRTAGPAFCPRSAPGCSGESRTPGRKPPLSPQCYQQGTSQKC